MQNDWFYWSLKTKTICWLVYFVKIAKINSIQVRIVSIFDMFLCEFARKSQAYWIADDASPKNARQLHSHRVAEMCLIAKILSFDTFHGESKMISALIRSPFSQ